MNEDFCFIILRYVCNENVNLYWQKNLEKLNIFYPNNKKIIIDDHSIFEPKYTLLDKSIKNNNLIIINSELEPKRGELLPYYYFFKNRWAKYAIIIHDSIFFHKKIIFEPTEFYTSLWTFPADAGWSDHINEVIEITHDMTEGNILLEHYKKTQDWCGSLGAMSIINHDFLIKVFSNNNWLNQLVFYINSRHKRMMFERLMPVIFDTFIQKKISKKGVFEPDDHKSYFNTSYEQTFDDYINKESYLDVELIWTGRS